MRIVELGEYDEIKSFIRKHGSQAYVGNWADLDKYLDHFASQRRIYILRDKRGRLAALACVNNVDNIDFIQSGELPVDNPNGEIAVVHGIVIHDNLKGKGIMSMMLKGWLGLFPNVKFLMFRRHARDGNYKLMPVSKILRRTT
jgi:hypothetical protein